MVFVGCFFGPFSSPLNEIRSFDLDRDVADVFVRVVLLPACPPSHEIQSLTGMLTLLEGSSEDLPVEAMRDYLNGLVEESISRKNDQVENVDPAVVTVGWSHGIAPTKQTSSWQLLCPRRGCCPHCKRFLCVCLACCMRARACAGAGVSLSRRGRGRFVGMRTLCVSSRM